MAPGHMPLSRLPSSLAVGSLSWSFDVRAILCLKPHFLTPLAPLPAQLGVDSLCTLGVKPEAAAPPGRLPWPRGPQPLPEAPGALSLQSRVPSLPASSTPSRV